MSDQAEVPTISMQDALKMTVNPEFYDKPVVAAPTAEEVVAQPAVEETPEVKPEAPAFDGLAWLREQVGQEVDIDTIKAKLTAPAPEPVYKEPEFANEESKRLYEAFVKGDTEPVKEYLQKKELVASLKDKTPADLVKTQWKLEYGLTDAEVEHEFSKRFVPDELLEDMDKTIFEKKAARELEKLGSEAKQYFAKYEQDITLPSIEVQAAPASAPQEVIETPEAKLAFQYASELNKVLPTDVSNIPFEFNDKDAGISLKGQVAIPQEQLTTIKSKLSGNEAAYIQARYVKPDGTFNEDLFASDVYYNSNRDTINKAMLADVSHQMKLAFLKENRNYQEPGAVIKGDFAPSEDEQKRAWYRQNFM